MAAPGAPPGGTGFPPRSSNVIVPRTSTAPEGSNTEHPAKSRRMKTVNDLELPGDNALSHLNDLTKLQQHIFDKIVLRLREMDINVTGLTLKALQFILPQSLVSIRDWSRLFNNPMLITDTHLAAILQLEVSTATSPGPAPGTTLYYIRSFSVTVNQLLAVLHEFQENNLRFEETEHWAAMAENVADRRTVVYVRYVGMSSSVSAWQRYAHDLERRTEGIYGHFVRVLTEVDPHALPQATEERKLPTYQRKRSASSMYHCFIQAPTSTPLKIAPGAGCRT